MRTSRSSPRVAARIGRSIYRVCAAFSIAVLAVGLVALALAFLRDDPNGPALLLAEAWLLVVAALSWLIGRAIRYLTSSRSGWMSGRRWTTERRDERTRLGAFERTDSRAGLGQALGGVSISD